MKYNLLIGGAAGQGMETLSHILEKILKKNGLNVFSTKDYMSRVRGGHNFTQVRFGDEKITSHWDDLDGIIALNLETISVHVKRLKRDGFIICDEEIEVDDNRVIAIPLKDIARDIGNRRVSGSVALGAVLKLFDIELTHVQGILEGFFDQSTAIQNFTALNRGYRHVGKKFKGLRKRTDKKILINGNEAIAIGALAAGCKFYSAYPMTPSTSIMNYLASKMDEGEVVVEQAEDEIAAINMALGASYAGVRSMTGTSGGGFALMVEGLGLSGITEIPVVIAEIQRPGPATGFPTRTEQGDLKFVISASQGEFPRMVIALRSPDDAFYQTVRAFNLAEKYQIPVILLGDQYLADYSQTVEPFDFNRVERKRYLAAEEMFKNKEYRRYEITATGVSPRIIPGKIPGTAVTIDSDEHDEYGHITESAEVRVEMSNKRMDKLSHLIRNDLIEPEFIGSDDYDVLLLSWGSLYGPIIEAVEILNREEGKKYSALVFGDIWPLPKEKLKEKSKKAKEIINIEQNSTGQLASVIMENTGIKCTKSVLKYDGRPISSQEIYNRLKL